MDVRQLLSFSQVYSKETINFLESEFSRLKDECYLDHAGSTLYSNTQIKNITENLLSSNYANPHSIGVTSNFTHDSIEQIRFRILEHFNVSSDEYSVIFTSGATASLKLVAETFEFKIKNETQKEEDEEEKSKNGYFIYLHDNHTSVLGMRDLISKNRGAHVVCLPHHLAFETFRESTIIEREISNPKSNSLFVYSAQCNFSGFKYPLEWIEKAQNALNNFTSSKKNKWFTFLDASAYVGTNNLDLSRYKADFVCLSFYKMFGYPTGLGALIVKKSSANVLRKIYYGGGTVNVALSSTRFHVKRENLHERFEDGTLPFLSIIALDSGFKVFSQIPLNDISRHVFSLARHLHHSLLTLHHNNGNPVAKIYSDTDYEDYTQQGGIVTFNILRSNGEYVGYMEVLNMAALYKIQLRTGCFCNPGACQRHLNLSNQTIIENYDAGYTCGGSKDLINGKPTGCVRISFGYMSSLKDVQKLLTMIRKCFLSKPEILKIPIWWKERRERLYRRKIQINDNVHIMKSIGNCDNNDDDIRRSVREDEMINSGGNVETEFVRKISRRINYVNNVRLKRLFIYPIKSCAAFEISDSWILNSRGLQYDREWMIVTTTGVCLTQKQEVNLCLIRPEINIERNEMELSFPGMPSIVISLVEQFQENINGTICRGKVCGHKIEGIDCGSDVSEWLSLSLGRPNLRLIRQTKKIINKEEKDLSFVSKAQYLLINEASIFWLHDKLPEDSECSKETMLHRFRGNIVVSGCSAFQEINWKDIRIGNCDFNVDGMCNRCQMVCIDQTTGEKTVEPLRTLAEEFNGKLKFGIYLSRKNNESSILKIGEKLIYD
ncbi:molybdenum cofactor sulfurase [Leptopilina heterotoma]|uniref:molybdenum cofactor sulfurase n=1 Tax=Leptopilina heterotoma TaxID=63436 RepID=UPI001CA8E561|nr:molybdenum cofactor sulfurase [Leptopilina heterotoma]XP_043480915.1 molybdenum cofactor sulfurase [Leptopilina heterotoma]